MKLSTQYKIGYGLSAIIMLRLVYIHKTGMVFPKRHEPVAGLLLITGSILVTTAHARLIGRGIKKLLCK